MRRIGNLAPARAKMLFLWYFALQEVTGRGRDPTEHRYQWEHIWPWLCYLIWPILRSKNLLQQHGHCQKGGEEGPTGQHQGSRAGWRAKGCWARQAQRGEGRNSPSQKLNWSKLLSPQGEQEYTAGEEIILYPSVACYSNMEGQHGPVDRALDLHSDALGSLHSSATDPLHDLGPNHFPSLCLVFPSPPWPILSVDCKLSWAGTSV